MSLVFFFKGLGMKCKKCSKYCSALFWLPVELCLFENNFLNCSQFPRLFDRWDFSVLFYRLKTKREDIVDYLNYN